MSMQRGTVAGTRLAVLLGMAALAVGCQRGEPPATAPAPGQTPEGNVNVAYGTQDEDEVTGSVTSLEQQDIADEPAMSLRELLQGRFAGVQVVETPSGFTLRIRGGTDSLTGGASNDPLVIVDGMPVRDVEFALSGLKPHDIDRIDVLKDVASTSIYGVRGSAGVILITTKRVR